LITLFSLQNKRKAQYGTCLLVAEDGSISGDISVLKNNLLQDAREALLNNHSFFKNYATENNDLTAFIELVNPPVSIVVIGAGNDVVPLVKMADILGWETTVVDGRPDQAKKDRFVSGCQVIVSKPENVLKQLNIDDQTVFLLMTHNYNYDLAMLRVLLTKKVRYIGSLGPRKKLDRMLDELSEEGITVTDKQRAVIYGPVGLDIGADTPEEIALSVLAEIKAVLSSRDGRSLRENNEAIHSRSNLTIEQIDIREH